MSELSISEIIKKEYQRCAMDAEYFIRRYCFIQSGDKGRTLFELYPYQSKSLEIIKTNDRVIFLKARQTGISTLVACYSLWYTLFRNDKTVVFIALKKDTAKQLVTKVKYAYKSLPSWLKFKDGLTEDNKLSIGFPNGSLLVALASGEDTARSLTASLLVLDEAAFIDNAEELWKGAQPTLSASGGSAIIISSPNGVGNFFHSKWIEAEEGTSDFIPIKLDWTVHPNRDEAWKKKQLQSTSIKEFAQEHEAKFLGSGDNVFDEDILEHYQTFLKSDPLYKIGPESGLWVWKEPDHSDNNSYIICADVSRGDATDYSAFHVIEAETCEQVAEFKGKMSPDIFGHFLVEVGTKYKDALMIIDNATVGLGTIQIVIDRGYKNLFYMEEDIKTVENGQIMSNFFYSSGKRRVPGFTISLKTRPLLINKIDEFLRSKEVIIRSSRTISELTTFIWKNGKGQATAGCNDDLVLSLGLGLWVRETALVIGKRERELTKSSLGVMAIMNSRTFDTPTGHLSQDPYLFDVGAGSSIAPQNPTGLSHFEDLREWLK